MVKKQRKGWTDNEELRKQVEEVIKEDKGETKEQLEILELQYQYDITSN